MRGDMDLQRLSSAEHTAKLGPLERVAGRMMAPFARVVLRIASYFANRGG